MSVSDKRCFCRNVDCIVKTRASSEPGRWRGCPHDAGSWVAIPGCFPPLIGTASGAKDSTSPLKLVHGGSLSGAAFPVVGAADRGHSGSDHPGFPLGPFVYGDF